MTDIAFPYPAVLTNKDWQRAKGASRGTKSGVGATLTTLENAFAASPFPKLNAATLAGDTTDPAVLAKKCASLKQSLAGAARKLGPQATAADNAIGKAIPVFAEKSNQGVRQHLQTMQTVLGQFEKDLADFGDVAVAAVRKAFDVELRKTPLYIALVPAGATANDTMNTLSNMIRKVHSAGTIDAVKKAFHDDGPHRVLPTNMKLWDQLVMRRMPQWGKAMGGPDSALNTYSGLDWLMDVANEMNGDASTRLTKLAQNQSEQAVVKQFAKDYGASVVACKPFMVMIRKAGTQIQLV